MTRILEGVRILEVAEHTFVPAASAALADLGAEVIKIEHVSRGDAMRGLASTGLAIMPTDVHGLLEHSNRGKQSLGLDLTPARRPRRALQARRHVRRVPDEQAADACARSSRSTSTTSAPPTRTSSTCAARARATSGLTPTRVPTTRSPTGRAPVSPTARSGQRSTTSRCHRLRRSVTRSARSRSPARSWGRCSTARRTGARNRRRRVAARHRHVVDGRRRWRCRCR